MRSVAVALLVALALSALPRAARAADPSWQVSVGFGGVAREGAWTPVFVDITNEGDSQTGQLLVPVNYTSQWNAQPRVVTYTADVDLPRHAKKRYAVYVPSADLGPITLDLSDYRGRKDPPRFDEVDPGDFVAVVVGGDPGLLSFLNGMEGLGISPPTTFRARPGQGRTAQNMDAAVGRLGWADLPESWLGWDGASVVVLGDASFSSASQAGLDALRTWVEMGGTLIVPGGSLGPAAASSPFASLLPGTVTGTTTLPDLSALGAWVDRPLEARPTLVAQLSLARQTSVLCGTRKQPLIASRRVGAGRVMMAAFDYTATPVKYWDGQGEFWPKLFRYRAPGTGLSRQAEFAEEYNSPTLDLTHTVSTMPQSELPSLWLIIGFLLAYIAALVPVNYWVLHRLDRRELAWVTTPAVVVVFTLGAYGLGYGMRGGSIILNRIGIVEVGPGSRVGRGTAYVGIFSPARTGYELAVDASSAGGRDLSLADQHVRAGTQVFTATQPRITGIYMNMWTTRAFAVDYAADLGKGVMGYLEYDGGALIGHVRNDTSVTLQHCNIVSGQRQGKAVDIKPGEEAEVAFFPSQSSGFAAVQPGQYQASGVPNLGEAALSALALLPGQLPQSPDSLPMVVARTPDLSVPVKLAGSQPKTTDANLLIVHLPVRLARHRALQVPEWLISNRYVASSGSISSSDPYSGNPDMFEIDRGSMTSEYLIPLGGAPATATQLSLIPYGGGGFAGVDISAYDYTRHTWESLWTHTASPGASAGGGGGGMRGGGGYRGGGRMGPGGAGTPPPSQPKALTIPHPQDFMNPEGRVQVRVSMPGGTASVSPLVLRASVEMR